MILLYCKKCNNLIEKTDGEAGDIFTRVCRRCGTEQEFYIKYKAISTIIIDDNRENAIIE